MAWGRRAVGVKMASFGVVIVAKEDHSIIQRLVEHYLGIGAKQITIYYDGNAEFKPVQRPGLFTFIQCSDHFWKELRTVRPDALEQRQAILYGHALDRSDADWLLLVDTDEILAGDGPVGQALDRIPVGVDVLRVPNAEAIWSPDDDPSVDFGTRWFRWPIKGRRGRLLSRLVYGKFHTFLESGVAGHSSGKQFLRTNRRYLKIRAHCSIPDAGGTVKWIGEFSRGRFFIAHFDAISFEQWKRKFLRRYERPHEVPTMRSTRVNLVNLIGATSQGSDADLERLFRRIYCLTPPQIAFLRLFNLAFRRDIFSINGAQEV
jgi:hypothetical protein